jgi:AbrB family looped-hinge helix DNA binding protein
LPQSTEHHVSEEFVTIAVVTSNGQITIPKSVREALGVNAGDRVEFVELKKGVYWLVAATRDVRELKGLIPKPAKPVGVHDMRHTVAKAAIG